MSSLSFFLKKLLPKNPDYYFNLLNKEWQLWALGSLNFAALRLKLGWKEANMGDRAKDTKSKKVLCCQGIMQLSAVLPAIQGKKSLSKKMVSFILEQNV